MFADGSSESFREAARRAWAQAKWRPAQAHSALSYLFLFAFLIWLNVMVFIFVAPQLLRTFTGIETVFTQSPLALFNTTVFAASFGVTYLCFDPLRKALYVLRCFYAEAERSAEDLHVELQTLRAAAAGRSLVGAAALLVLLSILPCTAHADPAPLDAARLDDSIEQVLQRREYTWRQPPEKAATAEQGAAERFVGELLRSARKVVTRITDWLDSYFGRSRSGDPGGRLGGFSFANRALLYSAIGLSTAVILYFLWKQRRVLRMPLTSAREVPAAPDLHSEDIRADQLPEDGWLQLAREMMDRGELRLALRASYLASLAHLGQREFITIARHKSNWDYERELQRRARSRTGLLAAFDENRAAFERTWYGQHEVTRETLGGFHANLETIRAC